MEEVEEIHDKIMTLRVKGSNPKYIIVDQDTKMKLQASKHFIPALMQRNKRDGDTLYGVRVATVTGSIKFIDVV